MKKILLCISFFVIALYPYQSSAKFLIMDIDPQCHINGATCHTTGCQVSDTSSWSVPVAYDGECEELPNLSAEHKRKIFETANSFFSMQDMYRDNSNYLYLNDAGKLFVSQKLFPAIQTIIRSEMQKESPNNSKVAIYQYLASVIGYDYRIDMPDETH